MAARLLVVACAAHALQPHAADRRAALEPRASCDRRAFAGDRRAALEPRASCDRRAFGAQVAAFLTTPAAPALAISATTMSGKTRPDTGVVLVDEPTQVSSRGSLAAAAEVVTADKVAATLAFDSPWPLQKGNYYDVEAKSKEGGDGCFVVVKTPPRGAAPSALPKAWFADNIFNIEGRYGAYGAPQDIKLVGDAPAGDDRLLEFSFTALSPSNAQVLRKCFVKAVRVPGSGDTAMLVAGTTAARWKKENGEQTSRKVAESFRVVSTKPTNLAKAEESDYRFYKAKVSLSSSQSTGGAQYGGF